MSRQPPGYGDFGPSAQQYDAVRDGIPNSLLGLFTHGLSHDATVLDIGCGTGIVTRQLSALGLHVIGCDRDASMIEMAKSHLGATPYVVAHAETLPFENATFDAVTAFSAFHWFANNDALNEIYRILRPNGSIFIVNKYHRGRIRAGWRGIIQQFVERPLPDIKRGYQPERLLRTFGFCDIQRYTVVQRQMLSLSEAISYYRSISLWNLVPPNQRGRAENAEESYLERHLVRGRLPVTIRLIAIRARRTSARRRHRCG
jgi:ubiquinone/menaquinone biosynthesis C-methylase UbiE